MPTQYPLKENISSQVLKGIQWSTLSIAIVSLLQIGYTSIMARLLPAQAFGILALATIVLRFGRYFAQMGVGPAVIQKKEMHPNELRAAFTSSLFLGALFGAFFYLTSPLAGVLLKSDEVVPVIKLMSLSFLFTGLSTVSISLLRKKMNFQTLSIIEVIVFLISYLGVGIPMAFNDMGVWSLAAAMLTQNLIQAILTYMVVRHSVIPVFEWKYFKSLYAFGSKISLIGFVEFLSSSIDTMLIGRYLGDRILGFYNRAYMLVNLPIEYLSGSFSKVLFPAFSKMKDENIRLKKVYLSSFSVLSYLILCTSLGMVAAADSIVLVLLGKGWEPVIPILRLLAISAGINFLSHFCGIVCEAKALLRSKFKLQLTYFLLLSLGLLFLKSKGIIVMAFALVVAQLIRHIGYIIVVKGALSVTKCELLKSYYPAIISSSMLIGIIYITRYFLIQLNIPHWAILIIQMLNGALCLILFLKFKFNSVLRQYILLRLSQDKSVNTEKGLKSRILSYLLKFLRTI